MTKREWYEMHGCAHAHCPYDCEHPQPILDEDTGELWCGRCWFVDKERTPMIPCSPEVCN